MTWAESGLDSTVHVQLTEYKVEAVKPLFQCDSAIMYYPLYFPGRAIPGKFEHNIVVDNKAGASQFPRFESFDKKLKITKIGEGVEYFGGFRLAGSSLYGYGSGNEPAQVTVYNKKRQKVFYGTGPLFIIKREQNIVAEGVNRLRGPERGMLVITHYQRLLDHIKPDKVHVLAAGRIVASGGPELALQLEAEGYDRIVGAAA